MTMPKSLDWCTRSISLPLSSRVGMSLLFPNHTIISFVFVSFISESVGGLHFGLAYAEVFGDLCSQRTY